MNTNEGTIDRAVRIIAGLALISMVFFGPQTPWGWVGLILVGTGLAGWCPIYQVLGLKTCGVKKT